MWTQNEYFMILMKLRLAFLFIDLSQYFEIYLVVFTLKHIGMV